MYNQTIETAPNVILIPALSQEQAAKRKLKQTRVAAYCRVSTEVENLSYDTEKLRTVDLNEAILDMVADKNYVILSSGIKMLWERLSERFALKNVIADTLISADTKYFVVKLLQEKGYTVTAYGDGRNDYYMLKQADNG